MAGSLQRSTVTKCKPDDDDEEIIIGGQGSTSNHTAKGGTDSKVNMKNESPLFHGGRRSSKSISAEPFPPYIEPRNFNAATMDAQAPLGLNNIRNLSFEKRKGLAQGPSLNIFIGDDWACKMPWRLFQALSTRAREINSSLRSRLELYFPAGLSQTPFMYILEWLHDITTKEQFRLLKGRNDVFEDVSVCRAARLLGMTEYAQHIFDHYWAAFNNGVPTYDDLTALVQIARTEENVGLTRGDGGIFLDCVVTRVAQLVYYKEWHDTATLRGYLDQHPKIKQTVANIVLGLQEEERLRLTWGPGPWNNSHGTHSSSAVGLECPFQAYQDHFQAVANVMAGSSSQEPGYNKLNYVPQTNQSFEQTRNCFDHSDLSQGGQPLSSPFRTVWHDYTLPTDLLSISRKDEWSIQRPTSTDKIQWKNPFTNEPIQHNIEEENDLLQTKKAGAKEQNAAWKKEIEENPFQLANKHVQALLEQNMAFREYEYNRSKDPSLPPWGYKDQQGQALVNSKQRPHKELRPIGHHRRNLAGSQESVGSWR